jgi:magnesium transporter
VEEEEIAEVEMLLEAYFMHVDNTFNRLQTLNEYIQVRCPCSEQL